MTRGTLLKLIPCRDLGVRIGFVFAFPVSPERSCLDVQDRPGLSSDAVLMFSRVKNPRDLISPARLWPGVLGPGKFGNRATRVPSAAGNEPCSINYCFGFLISSHHHHKSAFDYVRIEIQLIFWLFNVSEHEDSSPTSPFLDLGSAGCRIWICPSSPWSPVLPISRKAKTRVVEVYRWLEDLWKAQSIWRF
jgi:hypothetical protein